MPIKWGFSSVLLILSCFSGCSSSTPFSFSTNGINSGPYASKKIETILSNKIETFTLQWLLIENTWYCRIISKHLNDHPNGLTLYVTTRTKKHSFHFFKRNGGDVFRLPIESSQVLIELLSQSDETVLTLEGAHTRFTNDSFLSEIEKSTRLLPFSF